MKVTLNNISKKADVEAHQAKQQKQTEDKVNAFFAKMADLGVEPSVVPDIVNAYLDLNLGCDENAKAFYDLHIEKQKALSAAAPVPKRTLLDHLKEYRNDIDVCLVDKETGEHILPAICYLDEEEQADPEYGYSDWEKWVLSLPLDHISSMNGGPLAVVNTDFNWDQTCFLLCQNDFEEKIWADKSILAVWAGAEFADRLAFLTEGKSFEHEFNAECMDALDLEDRQKLCTMLASSSNVCIAAYPDKENEFYAYSYHSHNLSHRPVYDDEVDIQLTEPGKGLSSSLDGKVNWAIYLCNKSRSEERFERGNSLEHGIG